MRIEKDSLGTKEIPSDSLFGINTLRAAENFPLSSETIRSDLFRAVIEVKQAAARANCQAGLLDTERAQCIESACQKILLQIEKHIPPIHPFQGGAGTSTNMAANELIANIALRESGRALGDYSYIDPLAHINLSQSTNDVYPTAVRIAVIRAFRFLHDSAELLLSALLEKEREFAHILKIGRTELQEAMPLSLGQEFSAYAECTARFRWRLSKAAEWIREVNLSGTAIGTGVNAEAEYSACVISHLRDIVREPVSLSRNLIDATQNVDPLVEAMGIMRTGAVSVKKIVSDLRLLSSGPMSGFAEIILPAVQAGSSIMPGKINPVILESCEQVCLKVMCNDSLVAAAAAESNFELPQFLPLIAHTILESCELFSNALRMLAPHIKLIKANEPVIKMNLERSPVLATLLSPCIGYEWAAEIVKESAARGISFTQCIIEKGILSREELDKILTPQNLASPGLIDIKISDKKNGG